MNGISTTFISTLRSSPVIVSVEPPGSLLGESSWRVTIPSMITFGSPPSVVMTITRVIMGSKYPAGSSVVSNSDFLLTPNVI